jgi:hypothetical protein
MGFLAIGAGFDYTGNYSIAAERGRISSPNVQQADSFLLDTR